MEMDPLFFYFSGLALICFDPLLSGDVLVGAAALTGFVWLLSALSWASCAAVRPPSPVVAGWWCPVPWWPMAI